VQTAAVRRILAFCGKVVHWGQHYTQWGQHYTGVVAGMHFDINVPPGDPQMNRWTSVVREGPPRRDARSFGEPWKVPHAPTGVLSRARPTSR
jgi:hypothetical protein